MTGRDTDATWRTTGSLCRELDWSGRRLIHELQNGLPCRTIPPGHTIDWHDPNVEDSLNVEDSEVSFYDEKEAAKVRSYSSDQVAFFGFGLVTVGIEVLAPSPPADALPSIRWAVATIRDLRDEKKIIPKGTTKAKLARLLEAEAHKAVRAGQLGRALKASYIENQLVAWGIWPLNSFE